MTRKSEVLDKLKLDCWVGSRFLILDGLDGDDLNVALNNPKVPGWGHAPVAIRKNASAKACCLQQDRGERSIDVLKRWECDVWGRWDALA